MKKTKGERLEPNEFYVGTRVVIARLSELAVFLNVQKPKGLDDFNGLTKQEIMDLYVTSRASATLLRECWETEADKLIAQALETGVVFPVSRDPKS